MKNLFCLLAALVAFNASAAFACEAAAEETSAPATEEVVVADAPAAEAAAE